MRGVGHELALELKGALEARQKLVECVPELLELVVGAGETEALVQVGGGDLPGGRRDRAQRRQEPAGDEPAEHERKRGHDSQGDPGRDQQLTSVGAVLGGRSGPAQTLGGVTPGRRWVDRVSDHPDPGRALPHNDRDGQHRDS